MFLLIFLSCSVISSKYAYKNQNFYPRKNSPFQGTVVLASDNHKLMKCLPVCFSLFQAKH